MQENNKKCPDHISKSLKYICLDCNNEKICSICFLVGQPHGGHKVTQTIIGDSNFKYNIAPSIIEKIQENQSLIKDFESILKKLEIDNNKSKSLIQEEFKYIFDYFNEIEAELIKMIIYNHGSFDSIIYSIRDYFQNKEINMFHISNEINSFHQIQNIQQHSTNNLIEQILNVQQQIYQKTLPEIHNIPPKQIQPNSFQTNQQPLPSNFVTTTTSNTETSFSSINIDYNNDNINNINNEKDEDDSNYSDEEKDDETQKKILGKKRKIFLKQRWTEKELKNFEIYYKQYGRSWNLYFQNNIFPGKSKSQIMGKGQALYRDGKLI